MAGREDDIGALKLRLEEAEELIRAIREGEVDALVVEGARPAEVFTLEGGPEPYRVFMEAMETGAAALDGSHRLLFANKALCQLLGRSRMEIEEEGLVEAFGAEHAAGFEQLFHAAAAGAAAMELQLHLGGRTLHLHISAAPLQVGPSLGFALTVTDLTDRIRAAAIEESERLARAVIASANEAVVVCDLDGRITHSNAAALAICPQAPLGKRFDEAIPLILPDMTGLVSGEDLIGVAVAGGTIQGIEATAPKAPKARSLLVSAAPLIVGSDEIRGCVVTMVDLTERKKAEQQQLLLMRELDHRVKNTLALVTSICARTASSEDTVDGFRRAFLGRIQALSATHNLLAEKSWTDLTLRSIVVAELAPFVGEGDPRLSLEGLDVRIAPRAATAIGLVLHELATNAVKYGALSHAYGDLKVAAALDPDAGRLTVTWRETGGLITAEPVRRGFGRTVIARSLAYAKDGGADLAFEPEGVACVMHVPWEDVVHKD
ncbi:HWE histidine kinase domain-containing protein [Jiella sp. M17.18]|uniref:HWE histidine kinase domain-containing protein n=1 Tax=Jiella sp. M17.18 TaxID=3234247 RepID=UPI0034DF215D